MEIEADEEILTRIAFAFAGGMGNTGSVCGAVVGAVMALSLSIEPGKTMEEYLRPLGVVKEFRRRFEAEMETIICRDLTKMDLTTGGGIQEFMESGVPQTVCYPAVGLAYQLAVDLLREQKAR